MPQEVAEWEVNAGAGAGAMGHLGKLRTWPGRRWDLGQIQKGGRESRADTYCLADTVT